MRWHTSTDGSAGRWRVSNETDAGQPIHVAAVQVAKISEVGPA